MVMMMVSRQRFDAFVHQFALFVRLAAVAVAAAGATAIVFDALLVHFRFGNVAGIGTDG